MGYTGDSVKKQLVIESRKEVLVPFDVDGAESRSVYLASRRGVRGTGTV